MNKFLRNAFVFMALVGAFMLAVAGPAGGIGFFAAKRQDPVKFNQYLPGATNGNCIPAGAKKYLPLFNAAAQRTGVDVNLAIAIAQQESGFNPKVTSPTGNAGLMQISVDKAGGKDPYDPKVNIDAGTNYIAQQLKTYSGKGKNRTEKLGPYVKSDLDLALAAYNAGPGNVFSVIPNIVETLNYVEIVDGNYQRILSCLARTPTTSTPSNQCFPLVLGSTHYLNDFGSDDGTHDYGTDIGAPQGTSVVSFVDGTVTRVRYDSHFQWRVQVTPTDSNDPFVYYFQHLGGPSEGVSVTEGQHVGPGTVLGHISTSVNAYHLHFGLLPNGNYNDAAYQQRLNSYTQSRLGVAKLATGTGAGLIWLDPRPLLRTLAQQCQPPIQFTPGQLPTPSNPSGTGLGY